MAKINLRKNLTFLTLLGLLVLPEVNAVTFTYSEEEGAKDGSRAVKVDMGNQASNLFAMGEADIEKGEGPKTLRIKKWCDSQQWHKDPQHCPSVEPKYAWKLSFSLYLEDGSRIDWVDKYGEPKEIVADEHTNIRIVRTAPDKFRVTKD
jgi:hypothetical protein